MSCIEEIAWRKGWIDVDQLYRLGEHNDALPDVTTYCVPSYVHEGAHDAQSGRIPTVNPSQSNVPVRVSPLISARYVPEPPTCISGRPTGAAFWHPMHSMTHSAPAMIGMIRLRKQDTPFQMGGGGDEARCGKLPRPMATLLGVAQG